MPFKISTIAIPQSQFTKLGVAESRSIYQRPCAAGIEQIDLYESYRRGNALVSDWPTFLLGYDTNIGLEITRLFPNAICELDGFNTAYFSYQCDIDSFDELKATTEWAYEELGVAGVEKLGWQFLRKEIRFIGLLQVDQVQLMSF
jgi:hypothetical protein